LKNEKWLGAVVVAMKVEEANGQKEMVEEASCTTSYAGSIASYNSSAVQKHFELVV
jgi:hypothetical protein